MIPSLDLKSTFKAQGFELTIKNQIHSINHSNSLPQRIAEQIILSANYCPFISENRICGDLRFTFVPFQIPQEFKRIDLEDFKICDEELWNKIESTQALVEDGKPIIIQGKEIFKTLEAGKKSMLMYCNAMSSLMVEFCDRTSKKGSVLDIGSGQGVNSIPLLKKGWHVTAIDNSCFAIELYHQALSKQYVENGRLKLINHDITDYNFDKNTFDLVICVDVLPYIVPQKLRALIHKIHQTLVLDGRLIGTLFYSKETDENDPVKLLENKLGMYCYPKNFLPAMLKNCGFHIEECSVRFDNK